MGELEYFCKENGIICAYIPKSDVFHFYSKNMELRISREHFEAYKYVLFDAIRELFDTD